MNELDYVGPARSYIRKLLALDENHFNLPIIEANTAPLALYYLQKALKNAQMGKSIKLRKRGLVWKLAWCLREFVLSLKSVLSIKNHYTQCDFLFICNIERQNDIIVPVVKQLIKEKDVSIVIVTKVPFPSSIKVQNPKVIYTDWSHIRGLFYLTQLFSTLAKIKRPSLAQSVAANAFYQWFETNAFKAVRAILIGKVVTQKYHPKIIVVTDPSDFEAKSFTLMGKKVGIPSLCIQYGMLSPVNSEYTFFSQDAVATFDSSSAKVLKGHGITPEKIHITGNPRFDHYKPDKIRRERTREKLKVNKNTPLVLFVSIPSAHDEIGGLESPIDQSHYKDVLKAIYLLPNFLTTHQLVVRPHPEEDISLHNPFLQDNPGNVIFDSKNRLIDILNAADLVITLHSTVGYEAIILDKPLIILNFNDRESSVDYVQRGVAIEVKRKSELVSNIESVLSNPTLRKKLTSARKRYRKEMGVKPHESVHRCVKLLNQLILKD